MDTAGGGTDKELAMCWWWSNAHGSGNGSDGRSDEVYSGGELMMLLAVGQS